MASTISDMACWLKAAVPSTADDDGTLILLTIKPSPFNSAVILVSWLIVGEGCLLPLSMIVLVEVPRIEPFRSKIICLYSFPACVRWIGHQYRTERMTTLPDVVHPVVTRMEEKTWRLSSSSSIYYATVRRPAQTNMQSLLLLLLLQRFVHHHSTWDANVSRWWFATVLLPTGWDTVWLGIFILVGTLLYWLVYLFIVYSKFQWMR